MAGSPSFSPSISRTCATPGRCGAFSVAASTHSASYGSTNGCSRTSCKRPCFCTDGFGGSTSHVAFDAFRTLDRFSRDAPDAGAELPLHQVVNGDRVFLEALLPPAARELITGRVRQLTIPARQIVTFNIGYVCGDKGFFHPDGAAVAGFRLPEVSLRPALTSSRQLRRCGLWTSALPSDRLDRLFTPEHGSEALSRGEREYVRFGERANVSQRFKCRTRHPWYVTPGVKVPDVVLPVFSEQPAMLLNDAGLVASNSLLCGYLRSGSAAALASTWYTSLTLLQLELEVHALGGGVMVLVPREAGNVRLAAPGRVRGSDHLARIDAALAAGRPDAAFEAGDEAVLGGALGFSRAEVAAIRNAATELAYWRKAARRPPQSLRAAGSGSVAPI